MSNKIIILVLASIAVIALSINWYITPDEKPILPSINSFEQTTSSSTTSTSSSTTTTTKEEEKDDEQKIIIEGTLQSFEVYVEHNRTKVVCDTGTYYLKTVLSMTNSKTAFWINEDKHGRWFCIEGHQYCWKIDGM